MGLIYLPPWLFSPAPLNRPTFHESLKCCGSKIFPSSLCVWPLRFGCLPSYPIQGSVHTNSRTNIYHTDETKKSHIPSMLQSIYFNPPSSSCNTWTNTQEFYPEETQEPGSQKNNFRSLMSVRASITLVFWKSCEIRSTPRLWYCLSKPCKCLPTPTNKFVVHSYHGKLLR